MFLRCFSWGRVSPPLRHFASREISDRWLDEHAKRRPPIRRMSAEPFPQRRQTETTDSIHDAILEDAEITTSNDAAESLLVLSTTHSGRGRKKTVVMENKEVLSIMAASAKETTMEQRLKMLTLIDEDEAERHRCHKVVKCWTSFVSKEGIWISLIGLIIWQACDTNSLVPL